MEALALTRAHRGVDYAAPTGTPDPAQICSSRAALSGVRLASKITTRAPARAAAASGVVVAAGAALARRLGISAPLLLVIIGIAASYLPFVPRVELEPEVVLVEARRRNQRGPGIGVESDIHLSRHWRAVELHGNQA